MDKLELTSDVFTKYTNSSLLKNDKENGLINFEIELKLSKNICSFCQSQDLNLMNSSLFEKLRREGIPLKQYKELLMNLVNIDKSFKLEDFTRRLKLVYKDFNSKDINEIDYVPYMTQCENSSFPLTTHFLSEEGVETLKEVLWLVYDKFPFIHYSPLIIRITSLIIIFLEKNETFDFMCKLIESNASINKEDNYKLRFHFKFEHDDYNYITKSFIHSLYNISNTGVEVLSHFQLIGFKTDELVESMFNSFFFEYLKPHFIHRLLFLFLHDGVKILYRVMYAILKYTKKDIVKIKKRNNIISTVKKNAMEIKDIEEFFTTAYMYKLTRKNNCYESVIKMDKKHLFKDLKHENCIATQIYYIPYVKPMMSYIEPKEFISLWRLTNNNIRIKNLSLIYQADSHGYSLSKVLNLKNKYSIDTWIMFFIEDAKGNIFGGIVSNLFTNTGKFIRPVFIYLFSIKPEIYLCSSDEGDDNL